MQSSATPDRALVISRSAARVRSSALVFGLDKPDTHHNEIFWANSGGFSTPPGAVANGEKLDRTETIEDSLSLVERYIERCLERLGEDGPEESVGANMHMAK